VLLAEPAGAATSWMADRLFLPAAENLVQEAKEMADFVIVDSPPLSEVIDALPLAQQVDEVVVVVRMGKSQLGKLEQLGEILATHGVKPVGFAIVGVPAPGKGGYYYTPSRSSSDKRKAAKQPAVRS
jgi:Mrp family chromosome partitioning ATPase